MTAFTVHRSDLADLRPDLPAAILISSVQPTFQATIPDILPDERNYTQALSLSRLAYDLESLLNPALAAAHLTVINYH